MDDKPSAQTILETDKFDIRVDQEGNLFGDVAYSNIAPDYIVGGYNPNSSSEDAAFDSTPSREDEELIDFLYKVTDDERLSRIYQLQNTFSLRADNRAYLHPHGTTDFDYKSIAEERKRQVERFKFKVRQENYKYLGQHPEVHAIISVAMKKLLHAHPEDPVIFLTDYFNSMSSGETQREFLRQVQMEIGKVGRYHRMKMKSEGKINFKPTTEVLSELSGEMWRAEKDINFFKTMNIGALAKDFCFKDDCQEKKKKPPVRVIRRSHKKPRTPRTYCGCKDWKLKKKNKEATSDADDEEFSTFSTLGNIRVLQTAEEVEDGLLGDGQFVGGMVDGKEHLNELTAAQASVIAEQLFATLLEKTQDI